MITRVELVAQLQQAGLRSGCHVLVHSSLRSMGPVDGGADTVLDSLLEAVGIAGSVAAPTFHGTRPCPQPYFDAATTPGKTGILGECLRSRPESLRSIHPSHSLAAIGTHAAGFLSGHLRYEAVGIGSPFDRIAKASGFVLLIGVSHQANTTIHCGEAYAGVRKFFWNGGALPVAKVQLPDGSLVEHQLDCSSSCSAAFNAIEFPLHSQGLIRGFRFGKAAACLMKGQDIIEATIALVERQRDVLFCTRTDCRPCSLGRQHALRGTT